jgi:hypothetical protein
MTVSEMTWIVVKNKKYDVSLKETNGYYIACYIFELSFCE